MKKSIKGLITVFAVCAVSALAAMASGCSVTDMIKEKIEQARCEHEWNDGEVTKEATCMEKGELTKTCTLCDKVETEEIERLDHVVVYVEAVVSTCTEKGITDGMKCSVCETKISGFQVIPALGHIVAKDSEIKPTCLETGLTEGEHCSRCNEVLVQQEIIPVTGHNIVEVAEVPATCTTIGVSSGMKCELCNKVYSGFDEIEKLSHCDTDDDSFCDSCSKFLLTTVGVGERIAGNGYRVYVSDKSVGFVLTGFEEDDIQFSFSSLGLMDFNDGLGGYLFVGGSYLYPSAFYFEGLDVVVGDGYIDFYFEPGTYSIVNSFSDDVILYTIDENTEITCIYETEIYKL